MSLYRDGRVVGATLVTAEGAGRRVHSLPARRSATVTLAGRCVARGLGGVRSRGGSWSRRQPGRLAPCPPGSSLRRSGLSCRAVPSTQTARAALTTCRLRSLGTALSLVIGLVGGPLLRDDLMAAVDAQSRTPRLWPADGPCSPSPVECTRRYGRCCCSTILGRDPMVAVLAIGLPFGAITAKVYADLLDESAKVARRGPAAGAGAAAGARLRDPARRRPRPRQYGFYRFECAVRSAVVLGMVGTGGLGFQLGQSFQGLAYGEMWTVLYALVMLGAAAELASACVRGTRPAAGRRPTLLVAALLGVVSWWHLRPVVSAVLWSGRTFERYGALGAGRHASAIASGRLAGAGAATVATVHVSFLAIVGARPGGAAGAARRTGRRLGSSPAAVRADRDGRPVRRAARPFGAAHGVGAAGAVRLLPGGRCRGPSRSGSTPRACWCACSPKHSSTPTPGRRPPCGRGAAGSRRSPTDPARRRAAVGGVLDVPLGGGRARRRRGRRRRRRGSRPAPAASRPPASRIPEMATTVIGARRRHGADRRHEPPRARVDPMSVVAGSGPSIGRRAGVVHPWLRRRRGGERRVGLGGAGRSQHQARRRATGRCVACPVRAVPAGRRGGRRGDGGVGVRVAARWPFARVVAVGAVTSVAFTFASGCIGRSGPGSTRWCTRPSTGRTWPRCRQPATMLRGTARPSSSSTTASTRRATHPDFCCCSKDSTAMGLGAPWVVGACHTLVWP